MSTITVIDPCDDTANTAFVNSLRDASQRRAVVHAPPSSEALVDEILRALQCDANADRPQGGLWRRREWAGAWICAFDRLELIVYGAWRLKTPDLRWLHRLAQRPGVRLWLVSHDQARNRQELLTIADVAWSWEQFRGYWRTRARNQRRRPRRITANDAGRRPTIEIDAAGPPAFWPWAIPQMLLIEGQEKMLMGAANRVRYGVGYYAGNAMRLAVRLHDLFCDWRSPGQRRFVLMAVKNALFCEHLWFDWDPAITAVNVPRRADQEPRIRRAADPSIAVSTVVARTARELGVDGEFRIGCDGSHILIETGETIPIAGPDPRAACLSGGPR